MFENVALALENCVQPANRFLLKREAKATTGHPLAPPLLFVGLFLIVETFCFFFFFLSLHNVVKCIE